MIEGIRKTIKYCMPEMEKDALRCWGAEVIVRWLERDEMSLIREYLSAYMGKNGILPPYTDGIKSLISKEKAINPKAVERWLSYCMEEMRQETRLA